LFIDIDRKSKFATTQLGDKTDRETAWAFLQHMLEAVPIKFTTIFTDHLLFAEQPRPRHRLFFLPMRFDMICGTNWTESCLMQPNHPSIDGQVERMNRTIKDATVERFHHDIHEPLRAHLAEFIATSNVARRRKIIGGLAPYECICKIWISEPDRLGVNPIHQMPGLSSQSNVFILFAPKCKICADVAQPEASDAAGAGPATKNAAPWGGV
jgi:hypothetical protein